MVVDPGLQGTGARSVDRRANQDRWTAENAETSSAT